MGVYAGSKISHVSRITYLTVPVSNYVNTFRRVSAISLARLFAYRTTGTHLLVLKFNQALDKSRLSIVTYRFPAKTIGYSIRPNN